MIPYQLLNLPFLFLPGFAFILSLLQRMHALGIIFLQEFREADQGLLQL